MKIYQNEKIGLGQELVGAAMTKPLLYRQNTMDYNGRIQWIDSFIKSWIILFWFIRTFRKKKKRISFVFLS